MTVAAANWVEWVGFLSASSVVVAFVGAVAAGRRQRRDLTNQKASQEAAEAHQLATQANDLAHQRRMQEREHGHQARLQNERRRHEALLRAEAAHEAARDRLISDAADAVYWMEYRQGDVYGLDFDWVPDHNPKPRLSDVSEVCEILRTVEMQHPTPDVRERAAGLRDSIQAQYGSIEPVYDRRLKETVHKTGVDPSIETFQKWIAEGLALIEAMHSRRH